MAAVLLGSPVITEDLDVCCPMTPENIQRILAAMRGLNARFRFHPKMPVLPDDPARVAGFRNFNLATDLGMIDLLEQVTGLGDFAELQKHVVTVNVEGRPVRVLDLEHLIIAKRAAGREKDRLGVMHLEALRKRQPPGEQR
jgi:hypothetical protein